MKKLLLLSSGGLAALFFSCSSSHQVHVKKESAPVYVLQPPSNPNFKCAQKGTTNLYLGEDTVKAPTPGDKEIVLKVAKKYIAQNNLVNLSYYNSRATELQIEVSKLEVKTDTYEPDRIKEEASLIAQVRLKPPHGQACAASKPITEKVVYQKPRWDNSSLPSQEEIKERAVLLAMEEVMSSVLPSKRLTVRPVKMDSSASQVVGKLVMHKKYDKAIAKGLEKLKASKKGDASLLYNIGVAYEAKAWTQQDKERIVQNLKEAQSYYEKALQINKGDKEINRALKDVRNDLELLSM